MTFDKFEELSRAVRAWSAANFPDNTIDEPFAGAIEELGEWAHALLKRRQRIRHTPEQLDAMEQDAIADLTIFLADWYARRDEHGTTVGGAYAAPREVLGRLADLSIDPSVIDEGDVRRLLRVLGRHCEDRGWDFAAVVDRTWGEVSARDWNADPARAGAGPPEDEAAAIRRILVERGWRLAGQVDPPLPAAIGTMIDLLEDYARTQARLRADVDRLRSGLAALGAGDNPSVRG